MRIEGMVQAFQDREFALDFPRMRLVGTSTDKSHGVWEGSGELRQNDRGQLTVRLLVPTDRDQPAVDGLLGIVRLGEIIPDEEYFALEAVDVAGRTWTSQRLHPSWTWGAGGVAIAEVFEASATIPTADHSPGSRGWAWFPGRMNIPTDEFKVTEEKIDGESPKTTHRRVVTRGSAGGWDFTMESKPGGLEVRVSQAEEDLPSGWDVRVAEALQFILGREVIGTAIWTALQNGESLCFRSEQFLEPTRATLPPLSGGDPAHAPEVLRLLDRYLRHIPSGAADSLHPLSAILRGVVAARQGSFDSQVLTTGVAVEAVLALEHADTGPSEQEEADAWKLVSSNIGQLVIPDRVRRRLDGFLGRITTTSARDRLEAMRLRGVVTDQHISAWQKLRHKAAHGGRQGVSVPQADLDCLLVVTDLLHRIVFQAIGYSGKFTDYTTRGFPVRTFAVATPNPGAQSADDEVNS